MVVVVIRHHMGVEWVKRRPTSKILDPNGAWHILGTACSNFKFMYEAQSVLSLQKVLTDSEISSRCSYVHSPITCNFPWVSRCPDFASLDLCSLFPSLLRGPDNPAYNDMIIITKKNNNSGLLHVLMLIISSHGIHKKHSHIFISYEPHPRPQWLVWWFFLLFSKRSYIYLFIY